uniref:Uncharacterized protein n=1 Tax=Salix viminalis TaxID=40686 RepID=A0A6N2LM75_SALVM
MAFSSSFLLRFSTTAVTTPSPPPRNSTEGTFQKHHQGPSVWHLEEEISFLLQATLSAIQGEQGFGRHGGELWFA